MNILKLELSDSDIINMDDDTGNITIGFVENLSEEDVVEIHFKEDPSSIRHQYRVSLVDGPDAVVSLDWIKQIDANLLMEGPFDAIKNKVSNKILNKRIDNSIKKRDKSEERDAKKKLKIAKDLLVRDMSVQGAYWTFYLAKPDGTYEAGKTQKEVQPLYRGLNEVPPQLANAIVTSGKGEDTYFVRKGLEDLFKQGVKYSKNSEVDPTYTIPWTTAEDETAEEVNTSSNVNDTNDKTTQSTDNEASKTTDNKSNKYSDKLLSKVVGVLIGTDAEVIDENKKSVDLKVTDDLTADQIAKYTVMVRNSPISMSNWIDFMIKNNYINESCDIQKSCVLVEQLLKESPVITLTDDELNNPTEINFKDIGKRAAEKEASLLSKAEREKKENQLKDKNIHVIDDLKAAKHRGETTEDILELMFDALVPSQGEAESVAGELVRAIMRILYRDSNDGDKFFQGYGLETCGSSAAYLFDNGFDVDIQNMLDNVYQLEDDETYTDAITLLAEHVIDHIIDNPHLLWTINEEDSRDYSYEYIEENQPRYEYEIPGSDDIYTLVEKGVLDSWDLIHYVEDQLDWDSHYEGAETARPWGYHDTSVTVENLTKDGYDLLQDTVRRNLDGFWEDLVSNYSDDLENNEYDDEYEDSDEE